MGRSRRIAFGAAIASADLADPLHRAALRRHCDLLVAEYEMKWDHLAPAPGHEAGEGADALAAFAERAGLLLRGHTLWWHEAVPRWAAALPRRAFRRAALAHLARCVGRHAGRVESWDVVNEPLAPGGGGLRRSRFHEAFGPGSLGEAFRLAAETDPGAVLVLNEMGIEYASPEAEAKRRALLRLLERERRAGTPIHALGIQSHLDAADQPRRHPGLSAFLREVDGLGLSVVITELDVSDQGLPRAVAARDRMVADAYRAYLDLVLPACRVRGVVTWGLSDARTWLAGARPRPDGAPVRPLPLDRRFRAKPALAAILAALGDAPAGAGPDRAARLRRVRT